jgi:hypothetical protein
MYMQGSEQHQYHVATHGYPSKFGFKDIIPTWKADKFAPVRRNVAASANREAEIRSLAKRVWRPAAGVDARPTLTRRNWWIVPGLCVTPHAYW